MRRPLNAYGRMCRYKKCNMKTHPLVRHHSDIGFFKLTLMQDNHTIVALLSSLAESVVWSVWTEEFSRCKRTKYVPHVQRQTDLEGYPMEVYGVFYCHLFLKERVVPVDIAAISWRYSSGGWNNSRYQRTTITPEVFEDLYSRCNADGMSMRRAARVLGDQWMQETGYVKLK